MPDAAEVASFKQAVEAKLNYAVGKDASVASERDWFLATTLAVRDKIVDGWMESSRATRAQGRKRVYYLSMEFLIGRLLTDALNNLGVTDIVRSALAELNVDLEVLKEVEPDAALGNGGLGRLAACFMESMATLSVAAYGYGIRYDHGFFRQQINNGWQEEYPEDWLWFGNPWEFERPEAQYNIGFGGTVSQGAGDEPRAQVWKAAETIKAIAYDMPVVGWRARHFNTLRLWRARTPEPLRLDAFNQGDYIAALANRVKAEAISKILYPSDATPAGQELRLRQEYFFVSASLQDLVRRHISQNGDIRALGRMVAIQMNDTHPAIAVAELMRILVDLHDVDWKDAWAITREAMAYTNHTLMPEALESWPVPLMERLLPRHMQIIYLINADHLESLRKAGRSDPALLASVSLIDEHNGRRVRMGHLAFVGSHAVNGVSALHSDLMKKTVFHDLHQVYPDRIQNKTNGIPFRRWLMEANPGLTRCLTETLGDRLLDDPAALSELVNHADNASLHARLERVRYANKVRLAKLIHDRIGVRVDPAAMFDVQIKRIHEYKRQLLNLLETVALYNAIRANPSGDFVPRVKIFAGKAAPSYHLAKLIIKLANDIARIVNNDPTVRGLLKVAFLPNYNVSLAEMIVPAADLSEQISTAGTEASGTGNMKLALNGALTIGTLDGANIEMRDHVGAENFFIFGMKADEVEARRAAQGISGQPAIAASRWLGQVLDSIASGVFSPDDPGRYRELVEVLRNYDHYMVTADFDSYFATQRQIDACWTDKASWWSKSIHNTARMGWFSSDRTIREYAQDIWGASVSA
ncbi:MAG TPA: glycogen/starch/alpha-glucan phosphorylase [Beijerinckiaceae bacterium]|nr:glycogen/starch/alpha-glucan phosphorylase [Beijerinckiaceae bacterium]